MNGLMDEELYRAATKGDMNFLYRHDEIHLLSRSVEGNNILHIAMGPQSDRTNQENFVKEVLERAPILICQTNDQGDTPLHCAARSCTNAAALLSCKNAFQKASELGDPCVYSPPWKAKNSEGNTPLHEALFAANHLCVLLLLRIDTEVAWYVNNSKETPLHAFSRHNQPLSRKLDEDEIEMPWGPCMELGLVEQRVELDLLLLEANISAAYLRDADGLTPLLRAAQCHQVDKVIKLVQRCRRSVELRDFDGQTLLHLMPLIYKRELKLLKVPEIRALIMVQDNAGNTPLHTAIKNSHFSKVKVLVQECPERCLLMPNYIGESPFDLIRSQPEVPHEIIKLLREKCPLLQSLYGFREAAMKENISTLLVIAVLLATITFAAAFTVPGGFDDKDGTPILMRPAAFKVFIISDAYAMCCSMLALFSLLWVMTGETLQPMRLIDLSVLVIQQSFYATTLAFVTGVYVTISPKALWAAIVVCALCSGLLVGSLKPVNLLLSRILPYITTCLNAIACCTCCASICYCLMGLCTKRRKSEIENELEERI